MILAAGLGYVDSPWFCEVGGAACNVECHADGVIPDDGVRVRITAVEELSQRRGGAIGAVCMCVGEVANSDIHCGVNCTIVPQYVPNNMLYAFVLGFAE